MPRTRLGRALKLGDRSGASGRCRSRHLITTSEPRFDTIHAIRRIDEHRVRVLPPSARPASRLRDAVAAMGDAHLVPT